MVKKRKDFLEWKENWKMIIRMKNQNLVRITIPKIIGLFSRRPIKLNSKPVDILRLTFLTGAFHALFSGARLCFHYMKTLALAYRQREKPLPLVAVF